MKESCCWTKLYHFSRNGGWCALALSWVKYKIICEHECFMDHILPIFFAIDFFVPRWLMHITAKIKKLHIAKYPYILITLPYKVLIFFFNVLKRCNTCLSHILLLYLLASLSGYFYCNDSEAGGGVATRL
jgi:hypothetical protein